ncbi:MAG: glycosyltransferase family 61 protein [Pseudomonadota bacterium]
MAYGADNPAFDPFTVTIDLPEATDEPGLLVGPTTWFADRIRPRVEFIIVPPLPHPAASASLTFSPEVRAPSVNRKPLWKRHRLPLAPVTLDPRVLWLDARPRNPLNWSHALNQILPLAIKARSELEARGIDRPMGLITQPTLSATSESIFRYFGFEIAKHHNPIEAPKILFEQTSKRVCRELGTIWMQMEQEKVAAFARSVGETPKKVFINRRGTRTISNNDAIEALLHARGFQTVFPEDLSAEEQFALFRNAEEVVAIHGAGLAPLIFRENDAPKLRLIEIFTPGHVVFFYNTIVREKNVDHIGVRGIPEREMLPDAFDRAMDHQRFAKRFSLKAFAVDPAALEAALDPEILKVFGR